MFSDIPTKKQRIAYVKQQMQQSDRWLVRGLMAIYHAQTPSERANMATYDRNGIGFTSSDSRFMSGCARQVDRSTRREDTANPNFTVRGILTPQTTEKLRLRMTKYAGQLVKIAELKQVNKSHTEK